MKHKNLLFSMLLSLGLSQALSCKGPSSSYKGGVRGANDETPDNTRPVSGDSELPDEATPLELLPNAGSKMRFLNGRALTAVYGRVFKPDAWGYAHCEKEKPRDYSGCSVIFAAEERPSMGFFDLYSQRMGRGVQNSAQPENLTLNYMRNLRAAVGRECNRLVTSEEKAATPATALIVKAGGPTAASLEGFFRKLLDVEGTTMALDVPFAEYVSAYNAAVAMEADKVKAAHNANVESMYNLGDGPSGLSLLIGYDL